MCHALMQWLDQKGVHYTEKLIDESDQNMQDFMTLNEGMIGTPFTVIDDGKTQHKIVGFDRTKLQATLGIS
jgi:glutaredoxin